MPFEKFDWFKEKSPGKEEEKKVKKDLEEKKKGADASPQTPEDEAKISEKPTEWQEDKGAEVENPGQKLKKEMKKKERDDDEE